MQVAVMKDLKGLGTHALYETRMGSANSSSGLRHRATERENIE
jgi:hypothetical protein